MAVKQEIDFESLLGRIRRTPEMFGFEQWHARFVIPYLHGCDIATGGQLFDGFAGWLLADKGWTRPRNYSWDGVLYLQELGERDPPSWAEVDDEESRRVLDRLFEALPRYFRSRGGARYLCKPAAATADADGGSE